MPAFWNAIENDPAAPEELKTTDKANTQIDDTAAVRVHDYLKALQKKHGKIPAYIEAGRGGRVQMRLIAELPYEISADARLALAKEFCKTEFGDKGVPYWAVIHAPDHHNDPRNAHMHVAFTEQPAQRVKNPETSEMIWDFEYQSSRKISTEIKRPHTRFAKTKSVRIHTKNWPEKTRANFAKLANKYLAKAGVKKTYDPRSYDEMGIVIDNPSNISQRIFA